MVSDDQLLLLFHCADIVVHYSFIFLLFTQDFNEPFAELHSIKK